LYASYGITTAQEGSSNKLNLKLTTIAQQSDLLGIDIVGYYKILSMDYFKDFTPVKEYDKHFRIGGAKFFLDGSPQAKTAWLTKPYFIPPEGKSADYAGYPWHEDNKLVEEVCKYCVDNDIQLLTHVNGDKAGDQLIAAYSKALEASPDKTHLRPVMVHAQTVRDDQLDKMKEIGMMPTYFHDHTYFWGDWHIDSVLGEEWAMRISPLRSRPFTGTSTSQCIMAVLWYLLI